MKSNQPSKRMMGSAKSLDGRVHVCHIFCDDDESQWSESDRAEVLRRMKAGFRFISNQSRRHDVRVTFVEHESPTIRVKKTIPKKVQVNHIWTENVVRKASGTSSTKFVKRIKEQQDTDDVIICLHVNKPALSYNLAFYKNVDRVYDAERMVCFAFYPDGRPTAAATYAHEILHLFGAGDLYFPYDQGNARKNRAAHLFPNDVMFRVDYDLTQLDVGAYTAFRVGWTDQLDKRFKVFDD